MMAYTLNLGMHTLNNNWNSAAPAHSNISTGQLIDLAASGGSSLVRVPIDLSQMTASGAPQWGLDYIQSVLAEAKAKGVKVIFEPGQTPLDLLPPGSNVSDVPKDDASRNELARRFGLLVNAVYTSYPTLTDAIAGWEVGNEPNLTYQYTGNYYGGAGDPSNPRYYAVSTDNAVYYAQYLNAVSVAIKGVEASTGKNIPVIGAGIAHNDYAYMDTMFATLKSLGADIDGFAIHPYTTYDYNASHPQSGRPTDWVPTPTDNTSGWDYNFNFQGALYSIQYLKDKYGYQSSSLWITEFGVPSYKGYRGAGAAGEIDQANFIAEAIGVLDSWSNDDLKGAILHDVLDNLYKETNDYYNAYDSNTANNGDTSVAEGSFGLYGRYANGTIYAKPAVGFLQAVTAGVDYSNANIRILNVVTSSNVDVSTWGSNGIGYLDGYIILTNGGDDTVSGSQYSDSLFAGDGNDTVHGNAGNDRIYGGQGNDILFGDAGDDDLYGNAGDDRLNGGAGTNRIDGGTGFDTLVLDGASTSYTWSGNGIFVTVNATNGTQVTQAINVEALFFTGNNVTVNLTNIDVGRGNGGVGSTVTNAAPTPANDAVTVQPGGSVIINVLANDTDPNGDTLTITQINGVDMQPGWQTWVTAADGLVIYNANGTLTYQPSATATGTKQFTYTVSDGKTTAVATVTAALSNTIQGTSGNDNLVGTSGNDTIVGLAGNDILNGGLGNDTMIGGLGDDTYFVDSTGDVVTENASEGNDTIKTGLASYSLASMPNVENLTYTGTAAFAGTGNATANVITGGTGNDTLDGGAGNDTLDGGAGNDTLIGGQGDDIFIVDSTGDIVTEAANAGLDTIRTNLAAYSLATLGNVENLTYTGSSAFTGTGNAASNTLIGGAGNDTLDGGAGNDSLIGGLGNDTYIVDATGDVVTEAANAGTDTIRTGLTNYSLASIANVENLTYTGTLAFSGIGNALNNVMNGGSGNDSLDGGAGDDTLNGGLGNDVLIGGLGNDTEDGGAGDDVLYGHEGNDTLSGSDGADTLYGQDGNDTLDGGLGNDFLDGGVGDDIYIVDTLNDAVVEGANAGIDTVRTNLASYSLAALGNVENLTFTGTVAFTGTGNAAANILTGGVGNDTLDGGTGNDTLIGGTGNDTYVVDSAGDVVTEAANAGTDTIRTGLASYSLASLANVENLTYTGAAAFTGYGNAANNVITGSSGNDTLDGGAGNDTLAGGAGNDVLIGGLGNDTEDGGIGDDVLYGHEGDDNLSGGDGNDTVYAQEGNDILSGGNGNDYLDGGLGNDTLTGGAGTDVFFISYDGSLDTLTDFSPSLGDVIVFNRASFGIPVGSAVSSYVTLGTSAPNSAHGYILANSNGVFWDADGSGAGAAVQIAKFTTAPTGMTLSSFNFA